MVTALGLLAHRNQGWKGQLRGAAPGPGGAGSCEKEGGLMRRGGAGNEKF